MNWIILVIKGKEIKRDYLSSGERKDRNRPMEKKIKEIVGKQYKNCKSQIFYQEGPIIGTTIRNH